MYYFNNVQLSHEQEENICAYKRKHIYKSLIEPKNLSFAFNFYVGKLFQTREKKAQQLHNLSSQLNFAIYWYQRRYSRAFRGLFLSVSNNGNVPSHRDACYRQGIKRCIPTSDTVVYRRDCSDMLHTCNPAPLL